MGQIPTSGSSTFRIVIRDKRTQPSVFSDWGTVWQRVGDIFTQFAGGTGSLFSDASAYFLFEPVQASTLSGWEPVVYLLDSVQDSLIARLFKANVDSGATGLTAVQGPANLSEVYMQHPYHDAPERLANTMIHELMHNKLNMDDSMHSLAAFVGTNGGFMQESLPRDTDLSPTSDDIAYMAPALSSVLPQKIGV